MATNKIYSQELLNDLSNFCDRKDLELKGAKAIRVMTKCILQGHYSLAERIGLKYRRILPQHDSVIAFQFSLHAQKFLKTTI